MNKPRELQARSHSLPPLSSSWSSDALTVTVMLPALLISTRMRSKSTPAATIALTALVTSCCRNVDGARAMVRKSAYGRSSCLLRQPGIVCLIVSVLICEVGGGNLVSPGRPPRNGTARKELEIRAGHKPLDPVADLIRLAAMLSHRRHNDLTHVFGQARRRASRCQ